MSEAAKIAARPTADQVRRFRALTCDERYQWLAGLLGTTHGLASEEAKRRWRELKQAQSGGFMGVVSAFAWALDRGDEVAASRCLSPTCRYESGGSAVEGTSAILLALRAEASAACSGIAHERRRSRVAGIAPGVALVETELHVSLGDTRHALSLRREVTVGRDRLVERIVDHDRSEVVRDSVPGHEEVRLRRP